MPSLLTPQLLRRLEQFQLLAARRAKSSARGERRSRARGQSVEFADYRNYSHGDDFRYIDWNLYGRLDKLFLKLYEEERELPVRIFLDASESMTFGDPRKFDFARQVAAAIGYVALSGFDRVSVVPFPELPVKPEHSSELAFRGALRSVEEWRMPRRWQLDQITPFEKVRILDPSPSQNLLDEAAQALKAAYPAFSAMRIEETWAGMIDATPDAVPVIDRIEKISGLFLASGFSGHGFGLGPGAGKLMADIVTGQPTCVDPTPFQLARFQNGLRPKPTAGL